MHKLIPTAFGAFCIAVLSVGCIPQESPRTGPTDEATQVAEPFVTLTETAANSVRQAIAGMDSDAVYHLRYRMAAGGCTGVLQKLDIDPEISHNDYLCVSHGIKIVVDRKQLVLAQGTVIDYITKDGREGFECINPNLTPEGIEKWRGTLPVEPEE